MRLTLIVSLASDLDGGWALRVLVGLVLAIPWGC
jgi:hypothetical protein